jgi:hypothetical protein
MKYVLLIYQPSPYDPKSLSPEEHKAIGSEYAAIGAVPSVTPGLPLGLVQDAITVRVRDGQTIAQGGPYAGAAGAVGGYYIVETDDREEAIDLASRIPAARLGGAVEVRPAVPYW